VDSEDGGREEGDLHLWICPAGGSCPDQVLGQNRPTPAYPIMPTLPALLSLLGVRRSPRVLMRVLGAFGLACLSWGNDPGPSASAPVTP
jgi:hypothetical protein